MKWALVAVMALLSGCATVADIEQTPETMSVMSGKSPHEFTDCVVKHLASSRKPSTIVPFKEGFRVIVPQKFNADPAALIDITRRSNDGSSVKVRERIFNMPLRPHDVQRAVDACISGE